MFGIDYQHISISLTTIPEVLKKATAEGLRSAGLGSHVEEILVDSKRSWGFLAGLHDFCNDEQSRGFYVF